MLTKLLICDSLDERIASINSLLNGLGFSNPHPDLLYFDDSSKLGVEQTKQIREFLALKPYQSKGRAVVLESAQNLTLDAQNSLLKTLEEPPEDAVLILAADSEHSFLPTILSRCQLVLLDEQGKGGRSSTLREEPVGLRLEEVKGEELEKFNKDIEQLLGSDLEKRFEYIEKLEDKEGFLLALIFYFREKMKKDPRNLKINKLLLQAAEYKKANVQIRAILEYLMLNLP